MSAFTPGPWGAFCKTPDGFLRVETPQGDFIANVPHTARANAALIVAAPDLLEALEGLLRAGFDNGVFSDDAPPHVKQRLQEARIAITKARGRGIGALLAESQA